MSNKTFACVTNSGTETVVTSITPTADIPKLVLAEVSMYVCFQDFVLPDWWAVLGSSGCRLGALTTAIATPDAGCAPMWDPASGATARIYQTQGVTTVNGIRFWVIASLVDSTRALDLQAGQQYELSRIAVDHTRTVGPGACNGCSIGASVGIDIAYFFSEGGDIVGAGSAQTLTWQVAQTSCRAITPVRKETWGAVKALYR